jgi:hypothetical protein
MIQKYSMILWAKANQEDFKVTVDKVYKLLVTLKEYGPELSPNYLPAQRKKDTKQFDLSYTNLEQLIKKHVNKEGKILFEDLGHTFGFFSSLKYDDSVGIDFSVGITNPKFSNSFVVNFPLSWNFYDDNISERLITLFKTCTVIFNPFWGCILNSFTLKQVNHLYENNMPTTIHWVNFWGEDIVHKVTEYRINNVSFYSKDKIDGMGYILILKKKPIDYNSEVDISLQNDVNRKLGFLE